MFAPPSCFEVALSVRTVKDSSEISSFSMLGLPSLMCTRFARREATGVETRRRGLRSLRRSDMRIRELCKLSGKFELNSYIFLYGNARKDIVGTSLTSILACAAQPVREIVVCAVLTRHRFFPCGTLQPSLALQPAGESEHRTDTDTQASVLSFCCFRRIA